MIIGQEFRDPTNLDHIFLNVSPDGINTELDISVKEDQVKFKLSRANLITVLRMLSLALDETPSPTIPVTPVQE